ncbi:MAG: AAA family ATPase [Saprospiraceae bacterium]
MSFVARNIEASIKKIMKQYPIAALTGPRQSGKTTLLKKLFSDYRYVSLENTDARTFATEDPNGFLHQYDHHVIIDEVQRVPSLFSYLQTRVDEEGEMGQYILSGSQNFHLMEQITQSLAGRVAIFKLLPFDHEELSQASLLPDNWETLAIKGCYPAIYDRNIDPGVFYTNYLQTYINRDVSMLSNVHNMRLFRNFIGLCATRVGAILNLSNLAQDAGVSHTTAKIG